MAQTIKLKRSATPGAIPSLGSLELGEIAINTYEGKLYIKKDDGTSPDTIVEVSGAGGVAGGDFTFLDNEKALFGTDSDFRVYHSGVTGLIENYTGSLFITNASDDYDVVIQTDNGAGSLTDYFRADGSAGSAILYHYGSQKLATTSTGVDVTGTATMDGLTVSSDSGGPVYLQDSNATATYNISELSNNAGNFNLQTRDSSGAFVNTDYQIVKNASGADYHRWFTQGTERLRIDSSGNVGIGTSAPDTLLHLSGDATSIIRLENTNAGLTLNSVIGSIEFEKQDASGAGVGVAGSVKLISSNNTGAESSLVFSTSSTARGNNAEAMRIDGTGALILNPNNATRGLKITTTQTVAVGDTTTYDTVGAGYGRHIFQTDSTEAMRIDSSQNVLVGTTDNNPVNNSTDTSADDGVVLGAAGSIAVARYNNTPMFANRTGDDGALIDFRKSAASVGSITADAGYLAIGKGDTGLLFQDGGDAIQPRDITGGANRDAAIDLGVSGGRFKDIYTASSAGSILTLGSTDTALTADQSVGHIHFTKADTSGAGAGIFGSVNMYSEDADGESSYMTFRVGTPTANNVERVRITSDGNVGIGTSTPGQKFHVEFANTDTSFSGGTGGAWGSDGIRIENTSATANTMAMLHLRNQDADIHIAGIRQGIDDSDLGFFFEGSEKVRFTKDGNVGIGTDSPNTTLELGPISALVGPTLRLSGGTGGTSGIAEYPFGTIEFFSNDPSGDGAEVKASISSLAYTGSTAPGGEIVLSTTNSGASSTLTERFRITHDGDVGIGTDSPASIFSTTSPVLTIGGASSLINQESAGSISFMTKDTSFTSLYSDGVTGEIASVCESGVGSDYGLAFYTATVNSSNRAERMRIDSVGKVGIGTTAPSYLLHLEDSNGADLALGNSTVSPSDGDYLGRIYALDSTDVFFAGINMFYHDADDGEMRFRVKTAGTNTDVMTLVDGRVGIGTNDPAVDLDINGPSITQLRLTASDSLGSSIINFGDQNNAATGRIIYSHINNSFSFKTNNINDQLVITSVGNVGIGTNSPDASLEISNTLNVSSVFTGSISGTTLTVTAITSGAVAVGARISDASIEPNTKIIALGTGAGGIGTYTVNISQTAVSQTLRSVPSDKNVIRFTDTDTSMAGGTHLGMLEFYSSDVGNAGVKGFIGTTTETASADGRLVFGTGTSGAVDATTKMVITSDGNVGIGTTSPPSTLTVLGPNDATGGITLTSTETDTSNKIGRIKTAHYTNAEEPFTAIVTNGLQVDNILQIGGGSSVENAATRIGFWTAADNTTLTGTEVMRINSAQNVGIGETSAMVAGYKLQVRNDNNGESNPLLISNRDTSVSTTQNVSINFGLSRDSGAFKPQAGRIRVGREGNTWDADDANIDSYMDFSVYQSNAVSTKLTIASDGLATFTGDIATPGIQMGSGVANDIQADGKTAYIGSAIFGDSAASNTPLAPVHIKGAGAPALRIEDLDNSNQVYDFISNEGVGLSIVDQTASITPLAFAHTTGNATFAADVIVTGDLFVTGTSTSVNVEDLNVEQGEITLNYGTGDTSAAANGAGIRIQDAVDASTDATILWNTTSDTFEFSHGIDITGSVTADGLTVDGSGNINFLGGTNDAQYIKFGDTDDDDIGNIFYYHGNNNMVFTTNTSEAMRIDGSGNVGLKNSSPSSYSGDGADLVIGTTSGDNGLSIISGTSGTGNIYFGDVEETGTGSRRGQIVYDHATDHMRFATAVSEAMRIDASGNVGIGTDLPAAKLHIENGDMRIEKDTKATIGFRGHTTGSTALAFRDSNAGVDRMIIDSSGNVGINQTDPQTKTHITAAGNGSGVTDVLTIHTTRSDVGVAFAGGAINFVNNDTNSAGQARIKVGSSNSTTIGYNSESAQSFIFETSTSGGGVSTSNIDGNATTITVTHATYSDFIPGQRIAINTGTYQGGYFIDTVTSDTEFTIADTDHDLAADSSGTPTIQFAVPRDSMIIRADGNVGIGTNAPTAILDVVGPAGRPTSLAEVDTASTARFRSDSSNADSLYIAEANSGALIQVNDGATDSTTAKPLALQPFGGNVGIGTDAPATPLDLRGDMRLDGPAGTDRSIYFRNQGTTGGQVKSDKNLSLWAGSGSGSAVQYLTIKEGGNVGIGTDSPATALEISANNDGAASNNTLRFTDTDTGTETNQQIGKIEFKSNDVSGDGALVRAYIFSGSEDASPSSYISFATNAGNSGDLTEERLRIDSQGDVGIGTTNPGARLDVNDVGVTDNAWNTLAKFRPDLSDGSAETSIHIQSYPSTTVVADRKAGIQAIDDLGVARPLLLNKAGGNVGINIIPTNAKLEVMTDFGEVFRAGNSSEYRIVANQSGVLLNGSVGIGTPSPSSTLDLTNGTDTAERAIRIQNDTVVLLTGVEGSAGNRFVGSAVGNAFFGTTSAHGLELATNNNVRMVIDSAGNTTFAGVIKAPAYKEEVGISSITSGTFNIDIYDNSVLLLDTAMTANWTINVRGDATVTDLNSALAVGESITVVCIATQGVTPYYNSVMQINGVAQTVKWQGGSAPTAGTASSIDSYSYTIIKTAASTYTVLGNATDFA